MIKIKVSKIRPAFLITLSSRVYRGEKYYIQDKFKKICPGESNRLRSTFSSGSKDESEEEKCKRIIQRCFEPNPSYVDHNFVLETDYKREILQFSTPPNNESENEKCQRIINEIFNTDKDILETTQEVAQQIPVLDTLQATTAKETLNELTQKVEKIDETPLVEAHQPSVAGFNIPPKVLGDSEENDNDISYINFTYKDYHMRRDLNVESDYNVYDELARRCLEAQTHEIDERLLEEMNKLGIPPTSGLKPNKSMNNCVVQSEVIESTEALEDFELRERQKRKLLEELSNNVPLPFELFEEPNVCQVERIQMYNMNDPIPDLHTSLIDDDAMKVERILNKNVDFIQSSNDTEIQHEIQKSDTKNLDNNDFGVIRNIISRRRKMALINKATELQYSKDTRDQKGGTQEGDVPSFDDLAQQCLDNPSRQIEPGLLKEINKLGVPRTARRSRKKIDDTEFIQADIMKKPKKPINDLEVDLTTNTHKHSNSTAWIERTDAVVDNHYQNQYNKQDYVFSKIPNFAEKNRVYDPNDKPQNTASNSKHSVQKQECSEPHLEISINMSDSPLVKEKEVNFGSLKINQEESKVSKHSKILFGLLSTRVEHLTRDKVKSIHLMEEKESLKKENVVLTEKTNAPNEENTVPLNDIFKQQEHELDEEPLILYKHKSPPSCTVKQCKDSENKMADAKKSDQPEHVYKFESANLNVLQEATTTPKMNEDIYKEGLPSSLLDKGTVGHLDDTQTFQGRELPSINLDEAVTLTELLKRVRERNLIENYRALQCKILREPKTYPVEGKCGNNPPSCPPAKPKCPPPAPVCPPPPKPPCPPPKPPCPDPCKPKCPPPKRTTCDKFNSKCSCVKMEKFLPFFIYLDTQFYNSRTYILSSISSINHPSFGNKNDVNKLHTVDSCNVNLIENLYGNIENSCRFLSDSETVNYARSYEPWSPIPSWPLTYRPGQKKLVCPKEGCKANPPKLTDSCGLNPCINFPKPNSLTKRFSALLEYVCVFMQNKACVTEC